jgi:ACS family hexuronate transporter-like MFS transporter
MIPSVTASNEEQSEDYAEQVAGASRSATWRWFICGLLLLATVVNYMDRLTINNLSIEIQTAFGLNDKQYGYTELAFGLAFAAGSLIFGWAVDRMGVYWLYPIVLVGWSAMGFLTGLSRTFNELLVLRFLLGLFEAGHFPCGLKTIQLLMAPRDRALGCSLLQSGTAFGAIVTPQVLRYFLKNDPTNWRQPFLVIGAGGMAWIVLWFLSIRPRDLRVVPSKVVKPVSTEKSTFWQLVFSPQFLALAIMVICINMNWHLFRVWLPKFLRQARGYDRDTMLNFTSFYYLAADAGAITAGLVTGWLARRGASVYSSRMWVFAACCLLTTMTTAAALLPKGPLLLGALLVVAFGGLGSYAAYYSLTQDLSHKHQGKISGALATITWIVTAAFHPLFGEHLDSLNNPNKYDMAVGVVGWLPMVALVATLALWHVRVRRTTGLDENGEILG